MEVSEDLTEKVTIEQRLKVIKRGNHLATRSENILGRGNSKYGDPEVGSAV